MMAPKYRWQWVPYAAGGSGEGHHWALMRFGNFCHRMGFVYREVLSGRVVIWRAWAVGDGSGRAQHPTLAAAARYIEWRNGICRARP